MQWDSVRDVYLSVGALRGVPVADEAPLFADPDTGIYVESMPCLVGECVPPAHHIPVRAVDGVHFCVGPEGPDGCATYSSGVVRYVDPIVRKVAEVLGLPVPPPRTMVTTTTSTTTTTTTTTTTSTTTTTTTTAPPG